MTPKTLRKERREKFLEILKKHFPQETGLVLIDIADELAAAAESRSELRGIQAAMFGDRPVTEADLDPTGEDPALKAFEEAMRTPGNWNWYPAKTSDEKAWRDLREFVGKVYREEGKRGFEEYFTWSIQPYSRGAMSVLAIKQNPGNFPASWAAFKASARYAKKTDEERPEYKKFVPEEKNHVSRPDHIKRPNFRKPTE